MTRLSFQAFKVKQLLTATEDEKLLEYKLYAKYRMVNKSLMISSIAKPSLHKNFFNYCNIDQMKKDNQLSMNSEEFLFPFGNGVLSGKDRDVLIVTSLSEKARILM